ncbi:MAG TPA: LPS-assembly protein LptD, partial [Bacteroidetes bacterium]|nr:LPS-assembly protein LptD [Bacteroidota bacterium]
MRQAVVLFTIQFLLFTGLTSLCSYGYAQDNVLGNGGNNPAKDSNEVSIDSGKAAILEEMKANSDLETEVKYKAEEFMILDMEKKSLYLQKGAELNYEDMALKADSIAINWENNTLTAGGKVDSTGQITGRPRLEENEQTYKAKGVDYNFKTRKGLVRGARTKQGEEYILADVVRKQDGETYYIKDGKFTSCDLEDPHYYIKSSKLKIIPKDKIITGPLMLVIEDFPLPLILPFGFFPSQTGQRSGIIMPTYGEAAARGFFLRNGGYYFALNDNFDLAFRGDIFSRGGWRVEAATTYNKRYAFKGNFKLEYALQRFGEKTDPAYREQKNFWVKWDHKQKITPQTDFTATVSLGSNNFFSNNSYDQRDRFSNTLKSTVNFNQRFANSPWRLNAQLSQSQNTQTRNVTLGLPTLDLSRTRWLPFKGPNATGKKWYHKIGLGYKATVKNQISVIDSLVDDVLFHPNATVTQVIEQGDSMVSVVGPALDYFSNGMIQSIPVSTQLTILKYITASPSLSYNEYWYIKSVKKTFNQA